MSLHVDGRKGTDHVSHGRRRSSGGRGAGDLGHQQIGSVGEGRAQPREGGAGGGVFGAQGRAQGRRGGALGLGRREGVASMGGVPWSAARAAEGRGEGAHDRAGSARTRDTM